MQFTYWLNHILMNVVPCHVIGEIHSGKSIKSWIDQRGFQCEFSIFVRSLFGDDTGFDSKQPIDFLVGLTPFNEADSLQIAEILKILKKARLGGLFAIETAEYSTDLAVSEKYTISQWRDMLEQLGTVVHVYDSAEWSLFLILKKLK